MSIPQTEFKLKGAITLRSFWLAIWALSISLVSLRAQDQAVEQVVREGSLPTPITTLSFSPRDQILVIGHQHGIRFQPWRAVPSVDSMGVDFQQVQKFVWHSDGDRLGVIGGDPGETGTVLVLKWPQLEPLWQRTVLDDVAMSGCWNLDGGEFALAGVDSQVKILGGVDGVSIDTMQGHSRGVTDLLCIDKVGWISCGLDQSVRVWDRSSRKLVRSLLNHTGAILAMVEKPQKSSEEEPMIATCGEDQTVRFWYPRTGRMLRFVRLKEAKPMALAWHPEGLELLVGCDDGVVRVLDCQRGAWLGEKRMFELPVQSLAIEQRGDWYVVGNVAGQWKSGQWESLLSK